MTVQDRRVRDGKWDNGEELQQCTKPPLPRSGRLRKHRTPRRACCGFELRVLPIILAAITPLPHLLRQADGFLHYPLTNETRHLIERLNWR